MRTAVRVLLTALLVSSLAAPVAAQEAVQPAVDNPTAGAVAQGVRPSLDDPASLYVQGAAYQSVAAANQSVGVPLGRVRIPAIDLEHTMYAGVDLSVLSSGPGHWVGTALPGEAGNVVVAGHRTTYGAPFGNLDLLEPGDMIYYERPSGVDAMYVVSETMIVNPEDLWITYETGEAITTLFACHPKGSAAKRIVVRARLVGEGRIT